MINMRAVTMVSVSPPDEFPEGLSAAYGKPDHNDEITDGNDQLQQPYPRVEESDHRAGMIIHDVELNGRVHKDAADTGRKQTRQSLGKHPPPWREYPKSDIDPDVFGFPGSHGCAEKGDPQDKVPHHLRSPGDAGGEEVSQDDLDKDQEDHSAQ